MLHLARGERLGVDVADLLKFQTALECDGVVEAAANEESILGVCVLAGKPLDTLLVGQGLFDLLGQSLQFGDEVLILAVRQRAAHTGKLGSQQVAGRQLGAVGFGGGDGDFRAGPGVHCGVGLTGNAGADDVHNADGAHTALLAQAQGSQRVGGLTALADDHSECVLFEHGIAVTELAGNIDLDRDAGQALKHIARGHADMVGGAAADDVETMDIPDGLLVKSQLGQVDLAVLEARGDRIADSGGLRVDLLHHEVLVAALLRGLGVPLNGGGLAGDGLLVDVEELDGVGGQAGNLEIVNVVDRAGVLEQRRNVGGDDGTVLALADDERAVLAHCVDDAGLVGKEHAQRVGATDMQHHAGDGVQCVACGLAHVIVVKQLGNDLGVGLGDEAEALVDKTLLDLLIVFNDSVVYDGNLLVTGIMRVCVDDGRLAMGRPAGMADAAAAGHGAAAVGHLAQDF